MPQGRHKNTNSGRDSDTFARVKSSSTGASSTAQVAVWLIEARAGSTRALEQVLKYCQRRLVSSARRGIDPRIRAKVNPSDLIQDSLADFHRRFASFRGETEGELLAWVHGILENNLARVHRYFLGTQKRQARREVALGQGGCEETAASDSQSSDGARRLERDEQAQQVADALRKLTVRQQQVIRLRYWEKLSIEETARAMNCSPAAAAKLLARAIHKFKRQFQKGEHAS